MHSLFYIQVENRFNLHKEKCNSAIKMIKSSQNVLVNIIFPLYLMNLLGCKPLLCCSSLNCWTSWRRTSSSPTWAWPCSPSRTTSSTPCSSSELSYPFPCEATWCVTRTDKKGSHGRQINCEESKCNWFKMAAVKGCCFFFSQSEETLCVRLSSP